MSSKKEVKKRKLNNKTMIIISTILFIVIGILILLMIPKFNKNLIEEVTINYNEEFDYHYGKVTYGNFFKTSEVKPTISGNIDTKTLGNYNVKYTFLKNGKKIEFIQKVKVVDEKSPELIIDSDVIACPNGKIISNNVKAIDEYEGDLTNKIETEIIDNKLKIIVSDSRENKTEKIVDALIEDKTAPVITLKGSKSMSIKVGSTYKEEGASSIDACDGEVKVEIVGSVDTKKAGNYTITYKAKDSSGNESKVERKVTVYNVGTKVSQIKIPSGAKIIYLTFDDGPSKHTSRLLDVLKKYNVKATFFVTGYGSDAMIKREYNEGHTVALHSYTHDYCKIYKTVNGFFDDLYKVQNRVKKITGYTPYMMRFAGGSSNTVSRGCDGGTKIMSKLVKEVGNRGFTYYDWNVVSGDAGWTTKTKEVYNYVVTKLKGDYSVVLQHDSKGYSVDAVEDIIKFGLAHGFTFKKMDLTSPTAHHRVNN